MIILGISQSPTMLVEVAMCSCTQAGDTAPLQENIAHSLNTVNNLLLFLQKPFQNKSFPASPKHVKITALYGLAISQYY